VVERNPHWNITPNHYSFTSLTSSASHYPVGYTNSGQQAAFGVGVTIIPMGSTSAHSSTQSSGFQYLTLPFYSIPKALEDDQVLEDELAMTIQKYFEEDYILFDYFFRGLDPNTDFSFIEDELLVTNIKPFEEDMSVGDFLTRTTTLEEDCLIFDFLQVNITKNFTELAQPLDIIQSAITDNSVSSLVIDGLEAAPPYFSLTIASEVYDTQIDSLSVGINAYNLPAVSSITAYASTSNATPVLGISGYNVVPFASPIVSASANPFYPTLIVGGSSIVTNIQTAPPVGYNPSLSTFFCQWFNAPIGNEPVCSILNFDLQLDYSGGTWSFATVNDPGYNLGDSISIWGINGTVTGKGQIYSNSQVGTITKGIFGTPNMNKQLNILAAGNGSLFGLLTNSLLFAQQENSLGTFGGAARAIASLAGANLTVMFPTGDVPLVDFTVQEGETAIAALQSIASQFGAALLWDGGNNYEICSQQTYRGLWEVPSQYLLTPTGMQDDNMLDLSTGAFGTGFYAVGIEKYFDPSIYGPPSNAAIQQALAPQVQKVGSTSKQLTSSDPPWIVDCPLDTQEAWVQILVAPTTDSGTFSASQWVTNDQTQWFSLGSPSISNPNCKLNSVGGATVPQIVIQSGSFPNFSAVNNGNFIMSVGVTRNNNQALFAALVASRDQQLRNLLTKTLGSFRFVETYSGSISSYFFGSIPMPGMWAQATVCGQTIGGIVQSVSFTYPGIINVQLANFSRVNFMLNFYYLNLATTGGSQGSPVVT
jgi:hypothetical protein